MSDLKDVECKAMELYYQQSICIHISEKKKAALDHNEN